MPAVLLQVLPEVAYAPHRSRLLRCLSKARRRLQHQRRAGKGARLGQPGGPGLHKIQPTQLRHPHGGVRIRNPEQSVLHIHQYHEVFFLPGEDTGQRNFRLQLR